MFGIHESKGPVLTAARQLQRTSKVNWNDTAVEVIYVDAIESPAYHVVRHMARLAAELFNASFISVQPRTVRRLEQISGVFPRARGRVKGLMICPFPTCLGFVVQIPMWRKRYNQLVAWVFDSFWIELIPRFVRLGKIFDHVFVTEQEDLGSWRRMIHAPVDWLPWGADTLRLGSASPARPIDILRFGRQPPAWENDELTASACAQLRLRFQGRPPVSDDPIDAERVLMDNLAQSKFTLSFSNLVSPSAQTHPRREYITGRWTEALSAGATVVGIPPRAPTVQSLLWEGALIDLGTVDLIEGLQIIAGAVSCWNPRQALRNYQQSLQVLDWRWRFKTLALALDLNAPQLEKELRVLGRRIDETAAFPSTPDERGITE